MEESLKQLGADFSGVDKPKNEKDFYAIRYGDFTVPLIKAVQEQQQIIEKQQQQNEELKKRIEALENIIQQKH